MPTPRTVATRDSIRFLAWALFLVGVYWAIIAWLGLALLPGLLISLIPGKYSAAADNGSTPLFGLFMAFQAGCGSAIWVGWLRIAAGWQTSARWFWGLATLHHGFWAILWSLDQHRSPVFWYSAIVGLACASATIASQRRVEPATDDPIPPRDADPLRTPPRADPIMVPAQRTDR